MKRAHLILFIITAMTVPLFSVSPDTNATKNPNETALSFEQKKTKIIKIANERKDPYVAGVFSLFYSGSGQFYNGDFTKGSLFFLGETLCYGLNFLVIYKLQNTYSATSIDFLAMDNFDKALVVSTVVVYIALKIFSIHDAYTSSIAINEELEKNLNKINFSVGIQDREWNIICSMSF